MSRDLLAVRALPRMLAIAACACAGDAAVHRTELPAEPLAIVYRTADEARQRAEVLRAQRAEGEVRPGIARFADLERLVRGRTSRQDPLAKGRVARLDPRSGTPIAWRELPRGSVPLAWSTDHARLLVTAPVRGRHQLFALYLDTGELHPLTHGPARHPMGCLLPGDRLVMARVQPRSEGIRVGLWITGPDGAAPETLTPGPGDAFPTCSPDGRTIAFVRARRGRPERIVVLDLEGRTAREVATGTHPAYTPDGAWIVYSARTAHGARLWRVRPSGVGKAPIGERWEKGADEATPAVSPDGRYVAYVLKKEGRDQLRLRRMDGRGDRPLLEFGDGAAPVW